MITTTLTRRLHLFLVLDAALTALCLTTELLCHHLGFDKQYWKPWFIGIKYNDFLSFYPRFAFLHTSRFFDLVFPWPFAYPAPAALIYDFFYLPGARLSLPFFLAATLAIFVVAALCFRFALVQRGIPSATALGYVAAAVALAFPFWFCIHQANIEIVVWAFLALGVWAFCAGRSYSAAACFGIAASLKIVPFVYLALLIPRRQYKQAVSGLAVAAVVTFASLAFVGPTIPQAWHGIGAGLNAFNQEFLTRFEIKGIGFDHTLVGIYRRIAAASAPAPLPAFAVYLHRYTLVMAAAGALLWLGRIRVLPFLNQLLALTVAAIWLVPVSYEYTLLHFYLAIACLLLATLATPAQEPHLDRLLMLLSALCAPVTEFVYHGWTYGGQLQSVALGLVFFYVLLCRLPSHFDVLPPPAPNGAA